MITNNPNVIGTRNVITKLLTKKTAKNQCTVLRQEADRFISEGQDVINNSKTNKVSFEEARNFLAKLFKARKTKKEDDPFIQVSDKFTPHERELILGDEKTLKYIRKMIHVRKTPFTADLIEGSDKSVRLAVFHIGSKTQYIDMNKSTDDEISALVNNLIYNPFGFY